MRAPRRPARTPVDFFLVPHVADLRYDMRDLAQLRLGLDDGPHADPRADDLWTSALWMRDLVRDSKHVRD